MLIRELAAMIHQNAVEHGWWDEECELPELSALIHSEWSEGLEEARAGRPFVWFMCSVCEDEGPCVVDANAAMACGFERTGKKPEGVAVELIDGCIRILDVLGFENASIINRETGEPSNIEDLLGAAASQEELPKDVPTLVAWLHAFTSQALFDWEDGNKAPEDDLVAAMSLALTWVQMQGIDPLALLLEKHEYNKARQYKHGKLF